MIWLPLPSCNPIWTPIQTHETSPFLYSRGSPVYYGRCNRTGSSGSFRSSHVIQSGESVHSISDRLEQAGLIRNAQTFRTYLLWSGLDTILQTGTFRLSPAQTGRDIAQMLKSTTLTEVTFSVLPGWRLEEIAASLPTSGLAITPAAFLAARAPAPAPPG